MNVPHFLFFRELVQFKHHARIHVSTDTNSSVRVYSYISVSVHRFVLNIEWRVENCHSIAFDNTSNCARCDRIESERASERANGRAHGLDQVLRVYNNLIEAIY